MVPRLFGIDFSGALHFFAFSKYRYCLKNPFGILMLPDQSPNDVKCESLLDIKMMAFQKIVIGVCYNWKVRGSCRIFEKPINMCLWQALCKNVNQDSPSP